MGKREKAGGVKKEKIYALRKKLDDFIEEDKKRRDRNVYILERFERMRSTVALLKSINDNAVVENENNHFISRGNERVSRHNVLVSREDSDDRNILKEISKKFILIPRISSIKRYPDIDVKQSEEVNWRSKYSILDELKKREREEPPERDTSEHFLQTDSRLRCNNFSSIINNKNVVAQHKDRYNIAVPNVGIISNSEFLVETNTSSMNNNDCIGDEKIVENFNEQNDCIPVPDRHNNIKNISNVNKDSKCVEDQDDMALKVPGTKYSQNQNNFINILPEHNISKECYDAKYVGNKKHHELETYPDREKIDDKKCEDKDKDQLPELPSNILPELQINEKELTTNKTEQEEHSQQVHQVENPEIYTNDSDQWNDYYQEQNLQQEQQKQESYDIASQENQEMAENVNQKYEQEYGDLREKQVSNDYHSPSYENYEGGDNSYQVDNHKYEYQNVDQNSKHISSNDHIIPSEQSQEINGNFKEEDTNYTINKNGIEFGQQQQNYEQHSYVEPGQDQQQHYIFDKELVPENSVSENAQENFRDSTNQEEMYDMQHDYTAQNHEETEQQFDVSEYPSNQSDNNHLQHDYNNQINEIYQDNGEVQEEYDYSTQGLEIQQHNQQSDENQAEFVNYDTNDALIAQNEDQNFQEGYGDQNIQGFYQEENLQAQEIQDNIQFDYTTQDNELQHTITDEDTTAIRQESHVES